MTPDTYRDLLPRLGFSSIIDAGRWLGVSDRMARRWAQDGPPESVALLLEFMDAMGMDWRAVEGVIEKRRAYLEG